MLNEAGRVVDGLETIVDAVREKGGSSPEDFFAIGEESGGHKVLKVILERLVAIRSERVGALGIKVA